MTELAIELMKRISSNLIRAQQYEQEDNSKRELEHLLWASRDTDSLLLRWNDGTSRIDGCMVVRYAKSGSHIAEWIQVLIAARAL